jgi:hypothetical protein
MADWPDYMNDMQDVRQLFVVYHGHLEIFAQLSLEIYTHILGG